MKAIIKIIVTALVLVAMSTATAYSQMLLGSVYEYNDINEKIALEGVNVIWIGTNKGTVSDAKGKFTISKNGITDQRLIIAMLGYRTDTVVVKKEYTRVDVQMRKADYQIREVEIHGENDSYISKLNPRNVQVLTTGELYKAACCNLSESFETNASVDVTYSDAITGAKQIQMLGLSGVYSQVQAENVPSVRGLGATFGLNYIPGSWMESIQIAKGTSSVINGYESITGQINVEYKKPATSDKLFVNLYGNSNGRIEGNLNSAYKITDKLSTMILLHGDDFRNKFDRNNDNFLDQPKLNTVNVFNRWDFHSPGKGDSRFGIKYLEENRAGGTMDYAINTFVNDTASVNDGTQPYGFGIKTKRTEAFWKNGFMFRDKPYKSMGLIISGVNHEQTGTFGINKYRGYEKSFYANLLFQSIISNTNHKYTTGLSYIYDEFNESYDQTLYTYLFQVTNTASPTPRDLFTVYKSSNSVKDWDRTESVPGAFLEYTYNFLDVFSVIAGVRADYHSTYGLFYTPRLHLRWHLNETTIIRASGGLGYRSANVISENLSLLASQREIVFVENPGLEKAANYGLNFTKDFKVFQKKAEFVLDIYRTDFFSQVIVDLDSTPLAAYIYNLDGKSYSNSFQAQLTYEPVKRFSILAAFRINDVKTTINGQFQEKPFVNRYKGLITLSYATKFDKWKFDLTTQFNGSSRLPDQSKMPVALQRSDRSPEYIILNAQITKKFKYFDVYLGGENLTGVTQKDPITEAARPYHTHFDTTMVWGPVVGRVIYFGIRYAIK